MVRKIRPPVNDLVDKPGGRCWRDACGSTERRASPWRLRSSSTWSSRSLRVSIFRLHVRSEATSV